MKIRKVKWQNHPVLGNLEMDFMKADGTVYNNIVLIGLTPRKQTKRDIFAGQRPSSSKFW